MAKRDDKTKVMCNPPHVGEILREFCLAPIKHFCN